VKDTRALTNFDLRAESLKNANVVVVESEGEGSHLLFVQGIQRSAFLDKQCGHLAERFFFLLYFDFFLWIVCEPRLVARFIIHSESMKAGVSINVGNFGISPSVDQELDEVQDFRVA
jgi:hypothetical protein